MQRKAMLFIGSRLVLHCVGLKHRNGSLIVRLLPVAGSRYAIGLRLGLAETQSAFLQAPIRATVSGCSRSPPANRLCTARDQAIALLLKGCPPAGPQKHLIGLTSFRAGG